MVQLPGDEVLCDLTEPVRVFAGEGVAGVPALQQALVDVHAAAGLAVERLRHEGGDGARLLGDGLERVAEGDDVVGCLERR